MRWRASAMAENRRDEIVRRPRGIEAQHRDGQSRQPAFVLRPAASRLRAMFVLRRPFDELPMRLVHGAAGQQGIAEPALLAPPEPVQTNVRRSFQEDDQLSLAYGALGPALERAGNDPSSRSRLLRA